MRKGFYSSNLLYFSTKRYLFILKQEFCSCHGQCGPQIQNVTQTARLLSLKDNNNVYSSAEKLHTSVEYVKPLKNQKSLEVFFQDSQKNGFVPWPSIQRHKEAVSRYELNSMNVTWSWVGCSICIPSKRLLNSSLSKTGVWPGEAVFHYRCFETEKYLSSGQNFSCVQPHQTVAGTSSRIITFPLNIHLH